MNGVDWPWFQGSRGWMMGTRGFIIPFCLLLCSNFSIQKLKIRMFAEVEANERKKSLKRKNPVK